MQKLIELKKDENILVSSTISNFLSPDYLYLAIKNDSEILVSKKTSVKIGDPLIINNTQTITSPSSGLIKSIKKMSSLAKTEYFLEIENDFEERSNKPPITQNNLNKLTKEEINNLIDSHIFIDKEYLILNALDDEPYILTENFYLFAYYEEFLELLDNLSKIYNIPNVYVCVKSNSSTNINKLMSALGMYPHIELKILPDLYLLGRESFLCNYLNITNALTIKASTFYNIYNTLVRKRPTFDKLITISGDALKNPMIIKVKIGTLLKDVVNEFFKITTPNPLFIANGLMMGQVINIDNFVITDEFFGLLIMKPKEPKESGKCLNCSLCSEICPVSLNPLLFNDKKYYEEAKKICLNCGLCSYICPVYINFFKEGVHYE